MKKQKKKSTKPKKKKQSNFNLDFKVSSIPLIITPLLIALFSFAFLYPALFFDFSNFDDPQLLVNNPIVKNFSIKEMFTQFVYKDYLPLTFLSYAIEYSIFGMNPKVFHTTNIILHLFNIILVFIFILNLSKKNYFCTTLTTLLFAIFPTNAESIVWISERKDVLATFFLILSFISYLSLSRQEHRDKKWFLKYTLSLVFLSLSLFSKATAVVMGLLLLCIDYYEERKWNKKLFLEKIPYFLIGLIFVVIHIVGHDVKSEQQNQSFNPFVRIGTAIVSYIFYFARSIFPSDMSPFYEAISYEMPSYNYLLAFIALFLLFYFLGEDSKNKKTILFGFFFFTLGLLPIVNLVPLRGALIYADRYLYVPGIGLFFAYSFIIQYWFRQKKTALIQFFVSLSLFSLLGYYSYQFHQRIHIWQNSFTLWEDAIATSPKSIVGTMQLTWAYHDRGSYDKALSYGLRALPLKPDSPPTLYSLGVFYYRLNQFENATKSLDSVLKQRPMDSKAMSYQALVFKKLGRRQEAKSLITKALQISPNDHTVLNNKTALGL